MSDTHQAAKALAERLKKFLTWTGWHSTAKEPALYPQTNNSAVPLDARNTVVQILTLALTQARQDALEEAAVIAGQMAIKEADTNITKTDDEETMRKSTAWMMKQCAHAIRQAKEDVK